MSGFRRTSAGYGPDIPGYVVAHPGCRVDLPDRSPSHTLVRSGTTPPGHHTFARFPQGGAHRLPGASMGVFTSDTGHEQVVFCQDKQSGLRAIIGIYSTALGPALGGTRFYPYASADDALHEVLELSRVMAYKNALAGLD